MPRFRKRPVIVDAMQWTDLVGAAYDAAALFGDAAEKIKIGPEGTAIIETLEGDMTAQPGDWIIRGVHGELYPCKPDIFEKTYERVE